MISETPAPACKLAFVMALAMAGLLAQPAWAGPDNLRESLFGQHPAAGRNTSPPVARYVSQEGDVFVLDRSQNRPLLKFQDSPEVWALKP